MLLPAISSNYELLQFYPLRRFDVKSSSENPGAFKSMVVPYIDFCDRTSLAVLSKNDERRLNVLLVCSLNSVKEKILFDEFTSSNADDNCIEI